MLHLTKSILHTEPCTYLPTLEFFILQILRKNMLVREIRRHMGGLERGFEISVIYEIV